MSHRQSLAHIIVSVGTTTALFGGPLVSQSPAGATTAPPDSWFSGRIQVELPSTQSGVVNEPTTDVDGGENAADARPAGLAQAENTPSWQYFMRPAVPEY